ncbi:putative PAS/PAC sensor protein (plasmid) [Methylobacterium aquaticum]|uniref:Putative PAS/PAC sensor protein n=1 Tax=Methylobacterium aquaticum TaxID=270351 RepID=A0A0C6FQ90_9HYPH|nr:putative PAS/PAC sensor protein [Methylobacterium aquaticum]
MRRRPTTCAGPSPSSLPSLLVSSARAYRPSGFGSSSSVPPTSCWSSRRPDCTGAAPPEGGAPSGRMLIKFVRIVVDAILAGSADAIVASDRDGIIRAWNPGAVRIFGYAEAEAVGQSLDIIMPERLRMRH